MQKLISALFTLLLVLVPVIFYPYTSEVFEFNKLVTVYIFTVIITASWGVRMITESKFIFKKTLLDIPLLMFLASQVVATLTSIDIHTSIFGYYSRFNGGLLSSICYLLLYWAWVSNIDRQKTLQILKYFLYTMFFVAIWAIMEHFGGSLSCIVIRNEFNTDCWVQDVQTRVFASIGQPNWLAALLVVASPIMLYFYATANKRLIKYIWLTGFVGSFVALLFTKSRSGLLAFGIALSILIGGYILTSLKTKAARHITKALLVSIGLCILTLAIFGSIWTPTLSEVLKKSPTSLPNSNPTPAAGPALETGGTESGEIRKIVWQGAVDLWKKYPLTGSGVETFGFAYYETRPAEHNLVSEWDFIYNKAHNEYLNFLATTGIFGAGAYLVVITFSLIVFLKSWLKTKKQDTQNAYLVVSLAAGFVSLLTTNFFGFSVVATSLMFFILPASAASLSTDSKKENENVLLTPGQKLTLAGVFSLTCTLLYFIVSYWRADYFFAQSKASEQEKDYPTAIEQITTALKLSPGEALYHDQYAQLLTSFALAYTELKESDTATKYGQAAINEILLANKLAVRNVNLQRSRANMYTDLVVLDANFLVEAITTLEEAKSYSPTDAKIHYKLGLAYLRINNFQKAIENFQSAVALKPNYLDARMALGLTLIDNKQLKEAKKELEYILENLDPTNKLVKEELSKL